MRLIPHMSNDENRMNSGEKSKMLHKCNKLEIFIPVCGNGVHGTKIAVKEPIYSFILTKAVTCREHGSTRGFFI